MFFYGTNSAVHARVLAQQSDVLATINPSIIKTPLNQPFKLNLVDGRAFSVVFQRRAVHANGDVTLTGVLRDFGSPYSVVLTLNSRTAFGRIQTPQGLIRVMTNTNGIHVVDTARAKLTPFINRNDVFIPPSLPRANSSSIAQRNVAKAVGTSTIDVIIFYSNDIAAKYPNGLQTRINELVAVANKTYFDSQVDLQIRVVDTIGLAIDESKSSELLLSDLSQGLTPFENVADLRNQRGADMVVVLRQFRANANITCGVSWLNGANGTPLSADLAFAIVADGQEGSLYCEDITLAHELAHGMGSSHDIDNSDAPGVFPYSFGFGQSGVFGTVMSYFTPQAGYFSNPNLKTCFNQVCGLADVADNARSLNSVREQIATFRATTTRTQTIPTVATFDASAVTATSAMLGATIDVGGLDTEANFEYSTKPGVYELSTVPTSITADTQSQTVTQVVTGLSCNTTYYFRVVATNTDGTAQGVEKSFTTGACLSSNQPVVTTKVASDVTATAARLNGTLLTSALGGRYYFEYGESVLYGSVTDAQPIGSLTTEQIVAANVINLKCETEYHARLVFQVDGGSTTKGDDTTFITLSCAPSLPITVAAPIILDITANTAQLSATVKTPSAISVYFEYGTSVSYGNKTSEQFIEKDTTVIDSVNGLSCGQTYFVRVAATADGVTIVYSADKTFNTADCQLLPPLVAVPEVKRITANSADVQVNINANNLATTAWVEYGLNQTLVNKTTSEEVTPVNIPVTLSLFISDLKCETAYQYRVVANNPDGLAFSDILSFTTATCPPTSPVVTNEPVGVGLTGATLSATIAPHDQPITAWFEYGIASTTEIKSRVQTLALNTINFKFTEFVSELKCETSYVYRVAATINGQVEAGETKNFSTMSCLVSPAAVVTLDPVNIGSERARFRATLNPGGKITSVYFEYGLTTDYGQKTPRYSLGSPTLPREASWNVTGLTCGTIYHYRAVLVYENATATGQLVAASDVVFSTDACKALVVRETAVLWSNDDSASISVSMDTAGILSEVFVEFGTDETLSEKTETVSIGSGTVTFQLYNLICSTQYYFRVVAANPNGGVEGEINSFNTKSCAQQPTAITEAAVDISANMAKLSSRINPNGARTSVYFDYSVSGQSSLKTEPAVINSSFSDQIVSQTISGLQCDSTYRYHVVAANANGTAEGEPLTFTTASCQGAVQNPIPAFQLQVVAGSSHSVAVDDGGRVITWGNNENGQLGVDPGAASKFQALQNDAGATIEKIIRVAAGGRHSLALLDDGSVLAWGDNTSGQLANGNRTSSAIPVPIVSDGVSRLYGAVGIAAGVSHNLVLMTDGTVRSWGSNQFGQLGNNQKNPRLQAGIVAGIGDAVRVFAGGDTSFAILKNGTLLGWGDNQYGQLGDGTTDIRIQPTAINIDGVVVGLAVGGRHTLALTDAGRVLSWGANEHGQLGFTPNEMLLTPQEIRFDGKVLTDVTAIAAGKSHSLALLSDGRVLAWGDNASGQLGIGSTEEHSTATQVLTASQQPLTNIDAIAAGDDFSIALTKTGNLVGWGNNSSGQLGNQIAGDTVVRVPQVVKDDRNMSVSLKIPRILVSPDDVKLRAGDRTALNIRLSAPPSDTVVIAVKIDQNGKPLEVVGTGEFTFDINNWDKPQQVTIKALRDSDGKAGRGAIMFSATGLPSMSVNIAVEEATKIEKPKGIGQIGVVFLFSLLLTSALAKIMFRRR